MGILDDSTLRVLRDGRVIKVMHQLSERDSTVSGRGVKVDVQVRGKHGVERTKQVILKKVRPT